MVTYVKTGHIVLDVPTTRYLDTKKASTAATYRMSLRRFQVFLGDTTIHDFLKKEEEERKLNFDRPVTEKIKHGEGVIRNFVKWLQEKGYANNPIRGSLTAVQDLMRYYELPISFRDIEVPPQLSIDEVNGGGYEWTIEDLRTFVDSMTSIQDKTMALVMFQSGMAVREICRLNYGHVRRQLDRNDYPILIRHMRKKNNVPFKTLIGADAIDYLKSYLSTRGKLVDGDPLFVKSKDYGEKRMTPDVIDGRFREIAKRMPFVDVKDGEMSPVRPHSLRAFFKSKLTGLIAEIQVKFWMGDQLTAKQRAYLKKNDADNVELYKKIEKHISLWRTSEQVLAGEERGIVAEQSFLDRLGKLEQDKLALRGTVNDQARQIEGLNGEVKQLRGDVAFKMGEMKSMIEQLGRELNIETWDQVEPIPKETEPDKDTEK